MRVNKLIFIGIYIFFLSFASTVFAQCLDDQRIILTKFQQKIATMHAFKADFTQKIFSSTQDVSKKQNSQLNTGNIIFAKFNQFIWQINQPIKKRIIANSNFLWEYDIDLEQAVRHNFATYKNIIPLSLFGDKATDIIMNYRVHLCTADKNTVENYDFIAKNKKNNLQKISMHFYHHTLQSISIDLQQHKIMQIKFTNIKADLHIKNSMFNFKPQQNIDVIYN